jgi:hypothetical protein
VNTSLPGDLNLYGVFVPTPLVLMAGAFVLKSLVGTVLTRAGFYSRVWHPGLFNVALYVVLLGTLLLVLPGARL